MLIEMPSRNTTIDCSRWDNAESKSLTIGIHRYDKCNLVLDRDHNASINILNKGLNKLPQKLREVTLMENPKGSMKQEGIIPQVE